VCVKKNLSLKKKIFPKTKPASCTRLRICVCVRARVRM
jgi:hypothetical protein